MKSRVVVKGMIILYNSQGVTFFSNEDIVIEVVGFYKGLMGDIVVFFFVVDVQVMRNGVMLFYC